MLEIEYELREQDLAAFTEHQIQDQEHYQKILRRHQITFPALLSLIAAFVWLYYGNLPGAIYIGIIAIIWHYLTPITIKYGIRRRTLRLYSTADKAELLGHYKLRLEPQVLATVHAKKEELIPWRDVLRIEATKRYVFIYLDIDMALIIPRKTVKGDLHKFIEIADRRISAASE